MSRVVQSANTARFLAFLKGAASVYTNEPHGFNRANWELVKEWEAGRDDCLARIQPYYFGKHK
jgi:hypothetical protein